MFLAVGILLDDSAVVHFDDVPYLHQHLVCNLPVSLAPPVAMGEDASHGSAVLPGSSSLPRSLMPRSREERGGAEGGGVAAEGAAVGGAAVQRGVQLARPRGERRTPVLLEAELYAPPESESWTGQERGGERGGERGTWIIQPRQLSH